MVVNLLICIFGIPAFILYVLFEKLKIKTLDIRSERTSEQIHKFDNEVCAECGLLNDLKRCLSFASLLDGIQSPNCSPRMQEFYDKFTRENKNDYDNYCKYYPGMMEAYHRAERELGFSLPRDAIIPIYLSTLGKIKDIVGQTGWHFCPFGFAGDVDKRERVNRWMAREITKKHPEFFLYATGHGVSMNYKWNFLMNKDDYRDAYRLN